MQLNSRTICFPAPRRGVVAYESAYYVEKTGLSMMRLRLLETGDDIYDHGERARSEDNGRTWSPTEPFIMSTKASGGMIRRLELRGFVDPVNGQLLHIGMQALMPNDSPLDGMTQWHLTYRTSADGGRTTRVDEQIIQQGNFTSQHPLEPVWVGKNAVMYGADGSILRTRRGHLLVAAMLTPLGPDGTYHNPTGSYTWTEIIMLVGHWQDDGRIVWDLGPRLAIDPSRSTRGLIEPTMAQLPDGRILMVMRGSNDGQPELGGHKWYSVSSNDGLDWSEPLPWRYSDGRLFYSPSSYSQLVPHSNGKYYWFGNICENNPTGNAPRHPLVAGEVDPATLMLIPESIFKIDTLRSDDHPSTQLSNFTVLEDRASGSFILHMPRLRVEDDGALCGDSYRYEMDVNQ